MSTLQRNGKRATLASIRIEQLPTQTEAQFGEDRVRILTEILQLPARIANR